ncbi:hypothetical protein LCGC14_2037860 [marine sediment metagenome]|uniref:Uncharacterized protein n=1 Tax=marine sediment metagenome TaxID=412755 RepID=A0A0F9FFD4_9ZZZZ
MVSVRFWGMVCVVALCASVTLSDVIIDDFEDGAVDLTVWSGDQSQTDVETDLTGVIGGTRNTALEWDVGDDDVHLRVNRRDSGRLAFSSDPASSGTMTLTYGDSIATLTDITEAGANDRIRITFDAADYAGALTITVTDDSANVSTWTGDTPADLLVPSEDVFALFSAFTGSGHGHVQPGGDPGRAWGGSQRRLPHRGCRRHAGAGVGGTACLGRGRAAAQAAQASRLDGPGWAAAPARYRYTIGTMRGRRDEVVTPVPFAQGGRRQGGGQCFTARATAYVLPCLTFS